jgi:hypothetical protein
VRGGFGGGLTGCLASGSLSATSITLFLSNTKSIQWANYLSLKGHKMLTWWVANNMPCEGESCQFLRALGI